MAARIDPGAEGPSHLPYLAGMRATQILVLFAIGRDSVYSVTHPTHCGVSNGGPKKALPVQSPLSGCIWLWLTSP